MTNNNSYFKHDYGNGLRLLTVPMKSTKTVTVLVLVATGSRYETREINGISHFLEHLMFKGTDKRPGALDISTELDAIGADYNAFTSKEYTGYYVKCASEKLDTALDVISDIFQNSKFDSKEIDKERGAIKEEINMYFDTPMRYVNTLYEEVAYGDTPLGWDIAGPKKNIDDITREQILDYFNTHYFARNTVISIAGDIDKDKAVEEVGKYFNNVREQDEVNPNSWKNEQTEPSLKIFHKKTDQTHLNLGFKAYNRSHPKFHVQEVTSVLLGAGMSSRLFTEVREKRGLAYRVNAGVSSYIEVGDFITQAGITNEKIVPAIEVILNEYKKLTEESVLEKELRKTKDYIKGKTAIGLEASDAQASYYADQELLENKIETVEEKLEKFDSVTSEEIQTMAKDVFQPKNLNVALIGPFKDDDEKIARVVKEW
ncbi:MAG: pitrilysin family protein [Parcubacteria group bacterium]